MPKPLFSPVFVRSNVVEKYIFFDYESYKPVSIAVHGYIEHPTMFSLDMLALAVAGLNAVGWYPMNLQRRDMFSYSYVSENIDSAAAEFKLYSKH